MGIIPEAPKHLTDTYIPENAIAAIEDELAAGVVSPDMLDRQFSALECMTEVANKFDMDPEEFFDIEDQLYLLHDGENLSELQRIKTEVAAGKSVEEARNPQQPNWGAQLEKAPPVAAMVSVIKGRLDGSIKRVPFGTPNRKQVKRIVALHLNKGTSSQEFVEGEGDFAEVNLEQTLKIIKDKERNGIIAAIAFAGLISVGLTSYNQEPEQATAEDDLIEAAQQSIAAVDFSFAPLTVKVAEESIASTTSTLPPETTTSTTSATTIATTTTVTTSSPVVTATTAKAPVTTTTQPRPTTTTTSTTTTTIPFDQRTFGTTKSFIVESPLSVHAEEIRKATQDEHDADVLAMFNGKSNPDQVQKGERLAYKDCPANGQLINVNENTELFARNNGLTVERLHKLNGGKFKDIAGWCGKIAE